MGTYRNGHRMNRAARRVAPRHGQAGITAIGFLFLAAVFGVIGLAAIKLVPLYIQNMRLTTVLEDMERELQGEGRTPTSLRNELSQRLAVEGVRVPRDSVNISQARNGYQVRIEHEHRTPFIADLWFLVVFDKQVEISR